MLRSRPHHVVRPHDPMLEDKPDPDPAKRVATCRCDKPMVVTGDDLGVRCYRCGRPPARQVAA